MAVRSWQDTFLGSDASIGREERSGARPREVRAVERRAETGGDKYRRVHEKRGIKVWLQRQDVEGDVESTRSL